MDIPTRSEINRIGKHIREGSQTENDIRRLNLWRKAHNMPMEKFSDIIHTALRHDRNIIIVQRLKRLPTIMDKLNRYHSMSLSTMQDIGGIRVIVPHDSDGVQTLRKVEQKIKDALREYNFIFESDYILQPKSDGYRGIHLVFEDTNKLKVEIQIRTELEHCWATSVEIIDLMHADKIKTGGGDPKWREFLRELSKVIEMMEVPLESITNDMANGFVENIEQITMLNEELKASQILRGYCTSMEVIGRDHFGPDYFILAMPDDHHVQITRYAKEDFDKASARYDELEHDGRYINQVLVKSADVKQLKLAYPNYVVDTTRLMRLLDAIIKKHKQS